MVYTETDTFPFDKLVIAWVGIQAQMCRCGSEGIWYLKDIRRAMKIDPLLDQCKTALVCKGKPLAIEMALALSHRGIQVHVVDEYPWLCADFVDPEIMKPIQDELEKVGVQFHLGTQLKEIKGRDGHVCGFLTNEGEYPCDIVFVTGPVKPSTELARSIGVKCGATGGIVVDDHMRTNVQDVYAVGACVEIIHGFLRIPIHILPSICLPSRQDRRYQRGGW